MGEMVPTPAVSAAEAGLRAAPRRGLTRAAQRVPAVHGRRHKPTDGGMTTAVAPDGAAARPQGAPRARTGKRSLPSDSQGRVDLTRKGGGENRVGASPVRRHPPPPHTRPTTRPATAAEMAARLIAVA